MSTIWNQVIRPRLGLGPLLKIVKIHHNSDLWKRLTFLLATPVICLCMINAYAGRKIEPVREPFVKYEHLRRRTKRFPWGDGERSLFHNRETNALPEGYEK